MPQPEAQLLNPVVEAPDNKLAVHVKVVPEMVELSVLAVVAPLQIELLPVEEPTGREFTVTVVEDVVVQPIAFVAVTT